MLQLEVAGTVIQLEDTEAALVVYCHPSWKNQTLHVVADHNYGLSAAQFFSGDAKVIGRAKDNETIYAAIFPRLAIISKDLREFYNDRNANAYLSGSKSYNVDREYREVKEAIQLYEGNVTEIDWTDKVWK